MSYYDGDHPYLAEERRYQEEQERRREQEREERRAYERRCYEENQRQLASERERWNNVSKGYDDEGSVGWGRKNSNSYSGNYCSSGSMSNHKTTFGDYVFYAVWNLILALIWIYAFCNYVYDNHSNPVLICLLLGVVSLFELISIKNKKTVHLFVKVAMFLIVCSGPFSQMHGFMKWFTIFPFACFIAFYLLNRKSVE